MTNTAVLGNTILGGAGLGVAEYFSGGKVSALLSTIKDNVAGVMDGSKEMLSGSSPVAGALAPFALAGGSVYGGIKETKSTNLYNGVQKGLLTYGLGGVALGAMGLASIPMASGILAAGAGMFGVKKLTKAVADSVTSIKSIDMGEMISNGIGKVANKLNPFSGSSS